MPQYIFLDESGDLGFDFTKKRTSRYFIITLLFTSNKKEIEKIAKKTHATLKKKHKQKGGVLHAHHETSVTIKRLLDALSQKEIKILTICLNKKRVYTQLHNEKDVLYNYVVNILLDRIIRRKLLSREDEILLVASRKETSRFLNENFKAYLKSQVEKNHKLNIKVEIKTPHEEKSLQAVDFLCWSIFRKYEHRDNTYYEIIENKIYEEKSLFGD